MAPSSHYTSIRVIPAMPPHTEASSCQTLQGRSITAGFANNCSPFGNKMPQPFNMAEKEAMVLTPSTICCTRTWLGPDPPQLLWDYCSSIYALPSMPCSGLASSMKLKMTACSSWPYKAIMSSPMNGTNTELNWNKMQQRPEPWYPCATPL